MPATAGRVRMPANNRVHSSAALQTHGIWQSAIGYDPYAPDQKAGGGGGGGGGGAAAAAGGAGGGGGGGGGDADNAYDSFQGLLQLAKLTGSNADEARGACRKCHRVGHLTFQCRNFLTAKEDLTLAADVAADGLKDLEGSRKKSEKKLDGETKGERSLAAPEESEEEETDLSDSSEESGREKLLAKAATQRGLLRAKRKGVPEKESSGKHTSAKKSKDKKNRKKVSRRKHRKPSSDSESEDESDEYRGKKARRRRSKKDKGRKREQKQDTSDCESGSISESTDSGRNKRKKRSMKSSKKRDARD